jgi:hypothetical protein
LTVDPSPQDAIEEDGGLASVQQSPDLDAPVLQEAPEPKDMKEAICNNLEFSTN